MAGKSTGRMSATLVTLESQGDHFRFYSTYFYNRGFPSGSVVNNLPANAGNEGDLGLIPGLEDPQEEEMATTPVFLPGKSHEQRSLEMGSQRVGHD